MSPQPTTAELELPITGMTSASCAAHIERRLSKVKGTERPDSIVATSRRQVVQGATGRSIVERCSFLPVADAIDRSMIRTVRIQDVGAAGAKLTACSDRSMKPHRR